MRSICVFCGSSSGNDLAYEDAARSLGETEPITLLGKFKEYRPPQTPKWIDKSET